MACWPQSCGGAKVFVASDDSVAEAGLRAFGFCMLLSDLSYHRMLLPQLASLALLLSELNPSLSVAMGKAHQQLHFWAEATGVCSIFFFQGEGG